MNWNDELLRLRVRELERAADDLQARVDELAFKRWYADTLFPQAVVSWIWEVGL